MTIEQRLSQIEKSNGRLKLACAGLGMALAAAFVVGAEKEAGGVQDVVRAKRIEVVNRGGKEIASMGEGAIGGCELRLSLPGGANYFVARPVGSKGAVVDISGGDMDADPAHTPWISLLADGGVGGKTEVGIVGMSDGFRATAAIDADHGLRRF